MEEPVKKRVDESWKEQAEREKKVVVGSATSQPGEAKEISKEGRGEDFPQARFEIFVSGLVMEAFIAMGDMPHPTSHKQATNLSQAKYLIDLLGLLEDKTRGNLTTDEEKLLRDALYQLRMRYLTKAGS